MKALAKAISYRVFGTLSTALISYAATGSAKQAMVIGGAEVFTKIFLYYLHEKFWEFRSPAVFLKVISDSFSRLRTRALEQTNAMIEPTAE
ncbi:DUF2061 domain-containing protein [Bdellovibrionota bacterium FG-1]